MIEAYGWSSVADSWIKMLPLNQQSDIDPYLHMQREGGTELFFSPCRTGRYFVVLSASEENVNSNNDQQNCADNILYVAENKQKTVVATLVSYGLVKIKSLRCFVCIFDNQPIIQHTSRLKGKGHERVSQESRFAPLTET